MPKSLIQYQEEIIDLLGQAYQRLRSAIDLGEECQERIVVGKARRQHVRQLRVLAGSLVVSADGLIEIDKREHPAYYKGVKIPIHPFQNYRKTVSQLREEASTEIIEPTWKGPLPVVGALRARQESLRRLRLLVDVEMKTPHSDPG